MVRSKLFDFVVFILLVIIATYITDKYGQATYLRFVGVWLLVGSLIMTFCKKIPVGIRGRKPSFYLIGWKKCFAVLPVFTIGLILFLQ